MPKRVFFSFHYDDVISFRANVVRNHWVTKENREDAGFFDASIWEEAERHGDESIKRLIEDGLQNTSVTVPLIGTETAHRKWVRYEIFSSIKRGNQIFGVHINGIPNKNRVVSPLGVNQFDFMCIGFSPKGTHATPYVWTGHEWAVFLELPTWELGTVVQSERRGRLFQLSSWFLTYDWASQNGYEKFSSWVDG